MLQVIKDDKRILIDSQIKLVINSDTNEIHLLIDDFCRKAIAIVDDISDYKIITNINSTEIIQSNDNDIHIKSIVTSTNMTKYSKVIDLKKLNLTNARIAELLDISERTVYRYLDAYINNK